MLESLEYGLVVAIASCLGRMPRGVARFFSGCIAFAVYWCFGRLRRVGLRNLEMALPELRPKPEEEFCGVFMSIWAGSLWSSAG